MISLCSVFLILFFFFSSRRRHTRLVSDWSSDVCSSDLWTPGYFFCQRGASERSHAKRYDSSENRTEILEPSVSPKSRWRSEERRVGKECRYRGWRYN